MERSGELLLITGNYGSGKTEIALNLAFAAKRQGRSVVIADLDIVNPYFRTKDAQEKLRAVGIDLVASPYAGTNVDIPALPAEVAKCFGGSYDVAILDVGGDPEGAIALSRYRTEIIKKAYEMYFVVNTNRPDTASAEDIITLLRETEAVCGLSVTGLINNTNLLHESGLEHLLNGQEILNQVAEKIGVPVKYIAGIPSVLSLLEQKLPEKALPLELFLELPFDRL